MLVLYGACALLVVLTPLYGSCRPWVVDCNPSLESLPLADAVLCILVHRDSCLVCPCPLT